MDFERNSGRRPVHLRGEIPTSPRERSSSKEGSLNPRQNELVIVFRSLKSEIQALKGENQSLKRENEALKRKVLKKNAFKVCKNSYSRSDGLYKHLWEGDEEHKALAQGSYGMRCESCETDFKSWVSLQRHTISKHGQDVLKSADNLVTLESSDGSRCPVAAPCG